MIHPRSARRQSFFPQDFTCPVVLFLPHSRLEGVMQNPDSVFAYWTVTIFGGPFQGPSANRIRPHITKALPVSLATTPGIAFCFLFLRVLRCFSSPGSPPCSKHGYAPLRRMGYPIRRSPDHRMFGSSPGLIAAFHVLHRLDLPRHPPFARSVYPRVQGTLSLLRVCFLGRQANISATSSSFSG